MPSAQTVMTMQGNLAAAPYTLVFWLAYGQPDTTDANSGFPGQLDAATIKVNNIVQNGYTANPLTMTVGGDLQGTLPNPNVVKLQGHPVAVSTPAPNTGDVLEWTGSAWTPTAPAVPGAAVGGDLTGTLPNPTIAKLQGTALSIPVPPVTGQAIAWSGTAWTPSNTLQSLAVTSGNITAPGTMTIAAPVVDIAVGTSMSIDAPILDVTCAGNISVQADNNMTFSPGGDLTINGGLGAILISNTAGSGITINDPSGGSIIIDENGGGSLVIKSDSGINFTAPAIDIDPQASDFHIDLDANLTSGGTGYNFGLNGSAAQVGAGTGGNITLTPGLGASNHHGNIALISSPSHAAGVAGGSHCVWLGDRSTAPGTNPTGGLIVYSESGVLKVRSGANTVTLGNKPSVTGSKASGAALISLLTVLAAAGIITDNTTA